MKTRLFLILFLLLFVPTAHAQDSYSIPGLDGEITVEFDSFGIPQIEATTMRDLFAAQGFIHASARWWQMDWLRHVGAGRLAELVGERAVEQDKFMRTIGISRHAEHNLTLLTPDTLELLDAYARGVNAWLEGKTPDDLAPHYALLPQAVTIDAWTPHDTLTLQSLQALGFNNSSLFVEVFTAAALEEGGEFVVNLLLPPYPYDAHPVIMEPEKLSGEASLESLWASALMPEMIGSNNWVVSGELTASGKPLLANDTHMGVSMPSFWYENGLRCAACGFEVYGMSIAGTLGVVIGHNAHIGWGMTSAQTDMTDFYLLDINENNQYRYMDKDVELDIIPEPIKVAGGETVDFSVALTLFGPVFTEFEGIQLPKPAALHWTDVDGNRSLDAVLAINRASNWESFQEAVALFDVPGLNFVYADVEGNIGYVLGGRIPKRAAGHDGSQPVPGTDDTYLWQGYVEPRDNPRLFNPSTGYIFTANNAVIRPEDFPVPVAQVYDYGYRAKRIETLLLIEDQHSIESFAAIQFDNHDPAADLLIPVLKELVFEDDTLTGAVEWLDTWDRQNDADSPQAALFNLFWSKLLLVGLDELPLYDAAHSIRMMDLMLTSSIHPLWSNSAENLFGRETIIKLAFERAWDEMVTTYGEDRESWSYAGAGHVTRFTPALGAYIDLPEAFTVVTPSSGGFSSPNVGNYNPARGNFEVINIPTMRQILDFSDFENSLFVNSTGQSADPASRHYDDQVPLWAQGGYHARNTESAGSWVIR